VTTNVDAAKKCYVLGHFEESDPTASLLGFRRRVQ